jgi:hypothetical protein
MRLRLFLAVLILAGLTQPSAVSAQGGPVVRSAEPFKLGTFEIKGVAQVGIVLRDALIVELDAANRALERNPTHPKIPMPISSRPATRLCRVRSAPCGPK